MRVRGGELTVDWGSDRCGDGRAAFLLRFLPMVALSLSGNGVCSFDSCFTYVRDV